jgi:hypothetical protein
VNDIIQAPAATPPVKVTWRRGGSVQITGGAIADIAGGDRSERLRIAVALANILQDGSVPEDVMSLFDRLDVEIPDEDDLAAEQEAIAALATRFPEPRPSARARAASSSLDVEGR